MAVISVRIDDSLKKRMDRYRHINWSEVIRAELNKIVERLESRNVAEALLINEKVRKKSVRDTTSIIREWRENRYGESGG
jgi:predicted transcriptional regulator